MKKIAFHLCIFLLLCAPLAAQERDPSYRVGPRDLLDIRVYEDDKLNGQRRVTEDGLVNLPLLGDVAVQGKNTTEIGEILKKLLEARYMQRASVDVQVLEFRSRPIVIMGAVKQPGALGFSGRWTLLEALTAAGGLTESRGSVIHILRRAENGLTDRVTIDADELMLRADPKVNLPIYANDLINVPGTVEVTVYCLGEVSRPGAQIFKSNERISILTAIAHAGGLTDRASNRRRRAARGHR
jgi:polysaccharide biosynthesis/export protein